MASSPPPLAATLIQIPNSQTNGAAVPVRSPTIVTTPHKPTNKLADDEPTAMASPSSAPNTGTTATDKVMASTANLAQLLPTGTVLAYQALSPTFTNHGSCYPANRWLSGVLVGVLAALSLFFSFTDSVVGRDRKLYYGMATPSGFNVFNFSGEEEERELGELERRRLRLRPLDYVHALFTVVVFLTVAFSDVGLQRCFFPDAGDNVNQILTNLPLGMAFLSSFVFLIFPTKRKGIGYNDTTPGQRAA